MRTRRLALAAPALVLTACASFGVSSSPLSATTPSPSAANSSPAATAPANQREPDLAGKFDVGGHSLYLECHGTTGPVIVFEAGTASSTASWKRSRKNFIGLVENSYRRCLYDRTNVGKSDRVPGARTMATSAEELHTLLHAANLEPPYVVVGRSLGGYSVRLFAAMYPSEVRALVLIETLTPGFHAGMEALLTPEQWAEEVAFQEEAEAPLDIMGSGPLVAAASLPDVPLLVVAGTQLHSGNQPWPDGWPGPELDALWADEQRNLAAAVPRGKLVVFEGGDHVLQVSQPERLAQEINDFLADLVP